jgi:hypothetical protein
MRWSMTMRPFVTCLLLAVAPLAAAWAQGGTVYRCPNNVYTSEISEKEAKERGCRTIEGAPITIVSPPKRAPVQASGGPATKPEGSRVDAKEQRARDSDARAILEAELRREEEALAALQKEFNNGEPERRGDERNYVRYQERVEEMRNAIARKQSDVAALRRELSKLQTAAGANGNANGTTRAE